MSHAYCVEYFKAKPKHRDNLKIALIKLAEQSKLEDGCLQYDVLVDQNDNDLFILILKYTNAQTMKLHEQMPYIKKFAENEMAQFCNEVRWHDATSI
ncbi:antibiotic biosynthesis monooxygenase [Thiotrichales bacterium 19S3-7]|nr:antibiotic biosynthesis monooxygenase [Thiotrichales bacterium 19S3-7]MCF6802915.1 antibiotic biosynthesis monooxygenase [Thiotrichales bacterium 19S3-11]